MVVGKLKTSMYVYKIDKLFANLKSMEKYLKSSGYKIISSDLDSISVFDEINEQEILYKTEWENVML